MIEKKAMGVTRQTKEKATLAMDPAMSPDFSSFNYRNVSFKKMQSLPVSD
jgi:hypothetical protein